MINEVRTAVLAVVNKNNYGYITPADFNLYAYQAQMDLFTEYFDNYNTLVAAENIRRVGTEYAGLKQIAEEVIDSFRVESTPTLSGGFFLIPADCYYLTNVYYGSRDVERVSQSKLNMLNTSNITAPSVTFPAYTMTGNVITASDTLDSKIKVYPATITTGVTISYVRYPKTPRWTWLNIGSNGDPVFNSAANDYQDFELPDSDMPNLVSKILQYAGVSIREENVYAFGAKLEQKGVQPQ
jgi:hypothetical protein